MSKNFSFKSAMLLGVDIVPVMIEANILQGNFKIDIIGIPSSEAGDIKKRIISIMHELNVPIENMTHIINVHPAIRDMGMSTFLDLPIVLIMLSLLHRIPKETQRFLKESLICGELSLYGDIHRIQGALSVAINMGSTGCKRLILPSSNLEECSIVNNCPLIGVDHIRRFVDDDICDIEPYNAPIIQRQEFKLDANMAHVKGQVVAKRALEISAAGRHHTLIYGPPGSGKTMLANRLPSIMPSMTNDEIMQTTKIFSAAGKLKNGSLIMQRPFRAPHHSLSIAGLIGGGSVPYPGEISLANNGVLFLDEFLELTRKKIEMLRQALEDGTINIKRANYSVTFPAEFMLFAAMNPCPCGYFMSSKGTCTCSLLKVQQYLSKLSGPILDRIDIQIGLQPVDYAHAIEGKPAESSEDIKKRVDAAVETQRNRNPKGKHNATLEGFELDTIINQTDEAKREAKNYFEFLNLSMRSYGKVLSIARTIADIDGDDTVQSSHIEEAVSYRSMDRLKEKFNL